MISIFNIKTEEEYLKNKEYVDINELDNSERDALTVALKNSDIDKAKWLIKNGLSKCIICIDKRACILVLPCRHNLCCFDCKIRTKIEKCFICKANVEKIIKIEY